MGVVVTSPDPALVSPASRVNFAFGFTFANMGAAFLASMAVFVARDIAGGSLHFTGWLLRICEGIPGSAVFGLLQALYLRKNLPDPDWRPWLYVTVAAGAVAGLLDRFGQLPGLFFFMWLLCGGTQAFLLSKRVKNWGLWLGGVFAGNIVALIAMQAMFPTEAAQEARDAFLTYALLGGGLQGVTAGFAFANLERK